MVVRLAPARYRVEFHNVSDTGWRTYSDGKNLTYTEAKRRADEYAREVKADRVKMGLSRDMGGQKVRVIRESSIVYGYGLNTDDIRGD